MSSTARRWLVPEVVQTSAMDCGPAALKCLLDGFGTAVSYGRLREACQTDVDGTSIDTLEEIAKQLGLDAEQVMLPVDHLLLAEADALPAILVVRQPNGFTHFVVVWRRLGSLVQVMDPGMGRRWLSAKRLLEEVYEHVLPVPIDAFREWASSKEFLEPFRQRLASIGCDAAAAPLIAAALEDPGWTALAALDASTRMVAQIVESGGVRSGSEAAAILLATYEKARTNGVDAVPTPYWTARANPDGAGETVLLRGAVLIRVPGLRDPSKAAAEGEEPPPPLSPELVAALAEPRSQPARDLLRMLRAEGWLAPSALVVALMAAVLAAGLEAVLFRSLFEVSVKLGLLQQRAVALGVLVVFAILLVGLELPVVGGLLRVGRRLEARLRIAFLAKLPRLSDRYFQSRPTSDMAERSHSVHTLRVLPEIGGRLVRNAFDLVVTAAGIIWIDPASAPLALAVVVLSVAVPLAAQPVLAERDLRAKSHVGALGRFYLDALLGLVPVRTHGAERAVRREHEALLVEWVRASLELVRAVVISETAQAIAVFAATVPLVLGYLARTSEPAAVLLVLYWALNLPAIGEELAHALREYPARRNTTLRLLEPLGALEESSGRAPDSPKKRPIALAFEKVTVGAGGHTILEEVDLEVPAGQHVAIVGPSGAGKSSFVGTLLGWLRPQAGRVLIDGKPLDGDVLAGLRRDAAWVDPAVQLWNRSLLDNLRYGAQGAEGSAFSPLLEAADLHSLLSTLPDGLQTKLGESGALVSGGEGQRVRVGRALLRPDARLAILDEPFRGLDRTKRRKLLASARTWWKDATLLCVTHDVGETSGFDRVIVIDGGKVVEDGSPAALAADESSTYRAMLDSEETLLRGLWSGGSWRRVRIDKGKLSE